MQRCSSLKGIYIFIRPPPNTPLASDQAISAFILKVYSAHADKLKELLAKNTVTNGESPLMSTDNSARIPFKKLPKEQQEQILQHAEQMGLDTRLVKSTTFKVDKDVDKNTFTFTCPYFSFSSSYNGPSQEAMDGLVERYGGVIVGALAVMGGALVTMAAAGVAVAAANRN